MMKISLLIFLIVFTGKCHGQIIVDMVLKVPKQTILVYKFTRTYKNFTPLVKDQKSQFVDYVAIKSLPDNKFLLSFTNLDESDYVNERKFNAYIDNKGNNLSFYLGDDAEHLISILFKMPFLKVGMADTWKLGVDLTSFRGFLKCDSFYKKDEVSVINIDVKQNDTLVGVKYDFQEYFKGKFMHITSSLMKYSGEATFSVNSGRWISYECVKETLWTTFGDLAGNFNNSTKEKSSTTEEVFKLEVINEYPKQILQWLNY